MTDPSATPYPTRRQLRLAERAREASPADRGAAPGVLRQAEHPIPRPATPAPAVSSVRAAAPTASPAAPQTRRELRAAERAACPPPFAAVVRLPERTREAGARTAVAAKSGLLVALSGALLFTGLGLGSASSPDQDGFALRASVDRADAERATETARQRARVNQAATVRLSAGAAAFATAQRMDAVEAARVALETATVVKATAEPVLDTAELERLETAAAELARIVDELDAPKVPVAELARPDRADVAPPVRTEDVTRTARERPAASRSEAERDPLPADEAPSTDEATDAAAPTAPSTLATPEEAEARAGTDLAAPAAPVAPERVAAEAATAATTEPETTVPADDADGPLEPSTLAARATAEMEAVQALLTAAADVRTIADEVKETAEQTVARLEAERAAAAELTRKVEAASASPNGEIPADLLCAPAFAPDALLRCDAAAALEELNAAYREAHGRDLRVVSSYRSYSAQIATRASRGSLAARPGTSNHGRALAVDLGGFGSVGQFSDPDYLWMRENAGRFGWHHPAIMRPGGGGPQEPWHWEYGTDA